MKRFILHAINEHVLISLTAIILLVLSDAGFADDINCGVVDLDVAGVSESEEDNPGAELLLGDSRDLIVDVDTGAGAGTATLSGTLPEGLRLMRLGSEVTLPEIIDPPADRTYQLVAIEAFDETVLSLTQGSDTDAVTVSSAGCDSCQDCGGIGGSIGSGSGGVSSLWYRMGLGGADYGESAGYIRIYAKYPDVSLATPAALIAVANSSAGVTVNRDINDVITSITTPSGSIVIQNIVQTPIEYSYDIVVKDPLNVVVKTVTVSNPSNDPVNDYDGLHITESGEKNRVWQYQWSDTDQNWTLSEGATDGQAIPTTTLIRKTSRKDVRVDALKHTELIKVSDITVGGDVLVSETLETYYLYPWGEELIEEKRDPNGAALTTTWHYYDDSVNDGDNYTRLKAIVTDTGHWERYEYNSDGKLSRKVTQLDQDLFVLAESMTLAADDNLDTVYTYQEADLDDGGTDPETITEVIEKDDGIAVSTRYVVEWSWTATGGADLFEVWDIRCPTPDPKASESGATDDLKRIAYLNNVYDDPTSPTKALVTKTWKYEPGDDYEFEVAKVSRPDGTWTFYDRSTAGTTVATTGYLNSTPSNPPVVGDIAQGTRTTSVVDSAGNADSTKQERIEYGGTWFTVSLAKTSITDDFGRPEEQEYYFGVDADTPGSHTPAYTTETTYACCGVASFTGRTGLETSYLYDELGRRTDVIAPTGVTMRTTYNAADQAIKVERDGTGVSDTIAVRESTYDLSGRLESVKDGEGKYTFYTYKTVTSDGTVYDASPANEPRYEEVRVYPHDDAVTVPVQVTWTDPRGRVVRRWQGTSAAIWDGDTPTAPAGTDTLTEASRITMGYDWDGRVISQRTYHDLASIGLSGEGVISTNYYESTQTYDTLSRRWKSVDASGNISISIFDDETGQLLEQWIGTDATGAVPGDPDGSGSNNMAMVAKLFYDTNGDGTGNPVSYATRQYQADAIVTTPATLATDYVYTDAEIEWDDTNELRINKTMPQANAGPWTYQVYDYQGRLIRSETYHNNSGVEGNLLAQTSQTYDATTGNLTSTKVYEVTSGTAGDYLEMTYEYEAAIDGGRQVKTTSSGGGFTKTAFDTHGRTLRTVRASSEGTNTDADVFTDDVILTETVFTYDNADNVTETTAYERNHDATATGLLSGSAGSARITYRATWYDDAHRATSLAAYGTNGGSALTDYDPGGAGTTYAQGPPAPNSSDDVLVTKATYDDAGRVDEVTDNKGFVTKTFYDDMGRQVYVAESHDDFVATNENTAGDSIDSDKDRVTKFVYNAASQVTEQTALMNTGTTDDQTTTYTYDGAGAGESPVKRKDLLVQVEYPDGDNINDNVQMTYNADGSLATRTDQRGTVLTYTYTESGQRESQRITTLGSDTDNTVQSITYIYDDLNRLVNVTSHSTPTSSPLYLTDVVGEVEYVYNDLGQVETEYQQHGAAVNILTSPKIEYGYEAAASGVFTKGARLTKTTYPNGREIHRVYDGHSGIDDAIGRVNKLADESTTTAGTPGLPIVQYTYLGSGRMARKDYPTPDVRLDYIDEASGEGSTSDPYELSLDRFGRVVRHQWEAYDGSSVGGDEYFNVVHGYDRASNRKYADRQVYKSHSQYYTYDGLHRLDDYQAGKTDYDTIPDPDVPQGIEGYWQLNGRGYTLDQLGNQTKVTTPDATDYYENDIADGEANEYTTRKVKSDTAKQPVSEDIFFVDSSANWVNGALEATGSTSDAFSVGSGVLTISAVAADTYDSQTESEARTIVLLGEEVGPARLECEVNIPFGNPNAIAGLVFGYKSLNDYWIKAVDINGGGHAIYHVVNGTATQIGLHSNSTNSPVTVVLSGRRGADTDTNMISLTNGYPSGRVGLITNTANTTFDNFKVYLNETQTDLAGRWLNLAREANSGDNAINSAADRLRISQPGYQAGLPVLLDGVQVDQFEATFSVRPSSGLNLFAFVFNATDQADYDLIGMQYNQLAPVGFEYIDGGTRQMVTGTGTLANDPSPTTGDVVWYRVKYDGTSVTVKGLIDNTGPPSEPTWAAKAAAYTSTGNFDMSGGMIGFQSFHFGSVLIDDFTLKAHRDTTGNGTPDTWVTEHVDSFDADTGYIEQDLAYDGAGNLIYDGKHAFEYDAWNRLVKVSKAYTDGLGGFTEGSVVGTMQYDGLGRRTVKKIQNSANLDTTYHYYYDGQSVVQTDNGSDQMLKQYVWGLQYIDELCQIGLNLDPSNKDTKGTPGAFENIAERFFYALQDANYNVLGVIGAGGYLAERYEYTPYGQRTVYSHGVILPDIDGDGFIGTDDLNNVIGPNWNQTSEAAQVGDMNGDGYVGIDDLNIVNSPNWNKGTPPNDPLVTHSTLNSARQFKYVLSGSNPNTILCEVGHQGLFHDEEFGSQGGLIHNRARTLHSRLGRFMQREPLGYVDGMSLYQYVRSNSLFWVDPSGEEAERPDNGDRMRQGLEFLDDPTFDEFRREQRRHANESDQAGDVLDAGVLVAETFAQSLRDALTVDLPIKGISGSLGTCCLAGKEQSIEHTGVQILIGFKAGAELKFTLFKHDFGNTCPAEGNYFDSKLGISADVGLGSIDFKGGPRATPNGVEGSLEIKGQLAGFGVSAEANPLGAAKESISAFVNHGRSIGADIGEIKMFKLWLKDTGKCCDE